MCELDRVGSRADLDVPGGELAVMYIEHLYGRSRGITRRPSRFMSNC